MRDKKPVAKGLQLPGTFSSSAGGRSASPSPAPTARPTSSSSSSSRPSSSATYSTSSSSFRSENTSATTSTATSRSKSISASALRGSTTTTSRPALTSGSLSGSWATRAGSSKAATTASSTNREPSRFERLERARSTPSARFSFGGIGGGGGADEATDGISRARKLGLNRAVRREPSESPSEEEDGEDSEPVSRRKPRPSWAKGSDGEEEEGGRGAYGHVRSSSPAPRPRTAAASTRKKVVLPGLISTPARPDFSELEPAPEPHDEQKGTLFGSLWNKAASAWTGQAATGGEGKVVREGERRNSVESTLAVPEAKITPFEAGHGRTASEEVERVPTPTKEHSTPHNTRPIALSSSPSLPPVEPITYHRPPALHPRDPILHSVLRGRNRHRDGYDWLESLDESPLDPFLFHRAPGRMATKRARVRARPAIATTHATTAPAVMTMGAMAAGFSHVPSSLFPTSLAGSTGPVTGFVGPAQIPHPSQAFPPHPGPPPVPPPPPPPTSQAQATNHTTPPTAAAQVRLPLVAASGGSAGPSQLATGSNPSAAAARLPSTTTAASSYPAPQAPPRFAGVSSAPAASFATSSSSSGPPAAAPSYSFAPTSAAPPSVPVAPAPNPYYVPQPVFLAPGPGLQPVPPTSIVPAAPLQDGFKHALATRLFGTSMEKVERIGGAVAVPGVASAASAEASGSTAPQGGTGHPATSNAVPAVPPPSPLPTPVFHPPPPTTTTAHGALPPMPIPQPLTPRPPVPSSIPFHLGGAGTAHGTTSLSLYPAHLATLPARGGAGNGSGKAGLGMMIGVGGWRVPASSPSGSPRPVSASPGPPIGTKSLPERGANDDEQERPEETEGEEGEIDVTEANDPTLPAYAPSPAPTHLGPTPAQSPAFDSLAVPALAAASIPLPPSPAPSTFLSSSPAPSRAQTISSTGASTPPPVPPLPPQLAGSRTTTPLARSDDPLPGYEAAAHPPAPLPSISPALPPVPLSTSSTPTPTGVTHDRSLTPTPTGLDRPVPSETPGPPVPPKAPALPFLSTSSALAAERPSSLPGVSTGAGQSSAGGGGGGGQDEDSARIVLQPPTPIAPTPENSGTESHHYEGVSSTTTEPMQGTGATDDSERGPSPAPSLDPPTLSLSLDLDFLPLLSLTDDALSSAWLPSSPARGHDGPGTSNESTKIELGGIGDDFDVQSGLGEVERDRDGRLELPVWREENVGLEDDEGEDEEGEGEDPSFWSG
ncbi:hypothetical protein JCM10212_004389 [Sporobolomyces blumeae]